MSSLPVDQLLVESDPIHGTRGRLRVADAAALLVDAPPEYLRFVEFR